MSVAHGQMANTLSGTPRLGVISRIRPCSPLDGRVGRQAQGLARRLRAGGGQIHADPARTVAGGLPKYPGKAGVEMPVRAGGSKLRSAVSRCG